MPISRWRRLRHDFFRIGQQSPRGGIIEQIGKLFDVIIHHVLSVITAIWYGPPVRAPEEPVILVVALDGKTTLVREFVMRRTRQHRVVEAGFATGGPVLNVMRIDKAFVVASWERTALVPGHEGALLIALGTMRVLRPIFSGSPVSSGSSMVMVIVPRSALRRTRSERFAIARCAPSRESTLPQRSSRQRSSTRAVVVFNANDKSSSWLRAPTTRVIARTSWERSLSAKHRGGRQAARDLDSGRSRGQGPLLHSARSSNCRMSTSNS